MQHSSTKMLRRLRQPAVTAMRMCAKKMAVPATRLTLQTVPRRFMALPTADLCDEVGLDVSKIPSHKVRIVDPALNFRNFGGLQEFSGQITTVKAYESNPAVKKVSPYYCQS